MTVTYNQIPAELQEIEENQTLDLSSEETTENDIPLATLPAPDIADLINYEELQHYMQPIVSPEVLDTLAKHNSLIYGFWAEVNLNGGPIYLGHLNLIFKKAAYVPQNPCLDEFGNQITLYDNMTAKILRAKGLLDSLEFREQLEHPSVRILYLALKKRDIGLYRNFIAENDETTLRTVVHSLRHVHEVHKLLAVMPRKLDEAIILIGKIDRKKTPITESELDEIIKAMQNLIFEINKKAEKIWSEINIPTFE
jgi:hypothetical protein